MALHWPEIYIVMNETGGANVDGKDWVMELPQIIAEDCGWVLKAGVTGSGEVWLWFPGQPGKSSLSPGKVAELRLERVGTKMKMGERREGEKSS